MDLSRFTTGDLVFVNSLTTLSRLCRKFLSSEYGHVGIIVTIEGQPYVYEVTAEDGCPRVTLLSEYVEHPLVEEVAIRRLKKPLTRLRENAIRRKLLSYRDVRYPPLPVLIDRVLRGRDTVRANREMTCADLIHAILNDMGAVDRDRGIAVIPDSFLPSSQDPSLDEVYVGYVEEIVRRDFSPVTQRSTLMRQLHVLLELLL